jgi:hypothetical protein
MRNNSKTKIRLEDWSPIENNSELALMWNQVVSNSASNCIEIAIDERGDLVKAFPNKIVFNSPVFNSPVSTFDSYIITHNALISDQLSTFTIWISVSSIETLDTLTIPR